MAILIQKLDQKNPLKTTNGWLTIKDLEQAQQKEQQEKLAEFEQSVSKYLPIAAKRVQDLIELLNQRLEMNIPLAYLSIENNTTFHAVMLVSQATYLSPEMQAAKLLAGNDKLKNGEFDMHYTFTVGSEYMLKNSMTGNSYEIRNVPEFEKNLQVELVYLNQAV